MKQRIRMTARCIGAVVLLSLGTACAGDGRVGSGEAADLAQIERFLTFHESTRSEFEEVLDRVPVPDSTPRFDRLVVDSEDRIWVRRYALGGATTWEVLDSAGARLARVRIPPEARVMDARDDEVLLAHRTDLDVEYPARWALTQHGPGPRPTAR